jgi:predicted RNA-binding protein
MENVARLEVEDGSVRLQSLFGENKVMRGHIASIDFTEGRLLLRIVEE